MENILNKNFFVKIKYSKTPKKLPTFLSKEEIKRLIFSIENNKHRLMIKLMYGSGLRVNELINLRVRDFEFDKNYGWVRHGKGNKDRMFIIAGSLKQELLDYINNKNYDSFLFTTYKGHISARSVQEIVKKAAKKVGIKKRISCHTLRHSFSTHLIEDGYDVATVQSLLGHNSSETTMIYVHMANPRMLNVKSPIDCLSFSENGDLQPAKSNEKFDYETAKLNGRETVNKE